jgi:hypothetical protein
MDAQARGRATAAKGLVYHCRATTGTPGTPVPEVKTNSK